MVSSVKNTISLLMVWTLTVMCSMELLEWALPRFQVTTLVLMVLLDLWKVLLATIIAGIARCTEMTCGTLLQRPECLRTQEDYEVDVAVNDPSITGVKSPCLLNDISNFHVTKNFAPDIMHDLHDPEFWKLYLVSTY